MSATQSSIPRAAAFTSPRKRGHPSSQCAERAPACGLACALGCSTAARAPCATAQGAGASPGSQPPSGRAAASTGARWGRAI
eukprot:6155889-Prymnesium_polylepis.1